MPAYFGSALAGALQGVNQAYENAPVRDERILLMQAERQRQALLAQRLADEQAGAVGMLRYYGQPQSGVPGGAPAMAPGQPSVPSSPPQIPMPPPGRSVVDTGNIPSWARPAPSPQPAPQPIPAPAMQPVPSPQSQGVGPMGIAPYRSMQDIVQSLRQANPGMSPQAIMATADQINKNQSSNLMPQMNWQMKVLTLQNQLQNTESLIQSRNQAAEDRKVSEADRVQARQDSAALRQQALDLQKSIAELQHQDRQAAADTRVKAAEERQTAAREKQEAPVVSLISQIDAAIRMIDADPSIVGTRGILTRAGEYMSTFNNPYAETPGSTFQQQILGIQSGWRKLPTVAANRFKADYGKVDSAVKGIGTFTTPAQARNSLINLRNNLAAQVGQSGEPQGGATSEPLTATNPTTGERITSTDGGKTWQKLKQ